ncbi:MAG TPA: GNAT family N-acetyltransferase [Streptosporangiales bacterium]
MTSPRDADLAATLERFYDAVPRRGGADAEQIGPLTLFVQRHAGGYPFYARPTLGAQCVDVAAVDAVRRRQRELGVPEAFEWQDEVTPSLAPAARASGLHVHAHPLQVLDGEVRAGPVPAGTEIVGLDADSPDELIVAADAVANVAFRHGGTASGSAGVAERQEAADEVAPEAVARRRERLADGIAHVVAARVDGEIVAVASTQAALDVAEVVGVATLPAYRRRGLGAAVTAAVVRAAVAAGARTVFLSAGDEDVARMYASLGFGRVGTALIAEAPAVSGSITA